MVLVSAGWFIMGSNKYEDEKPQRRVYLDGFYIDKYPVTNARYHAAGTTPKRETKVDYHPVINGYSQPVVGVTWHQAKAYCEKAGKRLPTEAEWEKAARGTDERLFVWGSEFNQKYANFGNQVQPVGLISRDTSTYGLADMNGNVSEWTANWYQPYPNSKFNDRLYGKNVKVLRGGSFHKMEHGFMKEFTMLPYRNFAPPSDRFWDTGFRCAKSI